MAMLTERYTDRLAGMLSCYDRIVITGTLPGVCYAQGMTSFLNAKGIRIFDYPQFAAPLRDRVRECAQALAAKYNVPIQHINKASIRKEEVVAKVLKQRGDQPGLVHIISAMEACASYQPWHDKNTGKTFLRPDSGKCLHYYFYWMDAKLGLTYLRVPTYSPFRLQFYCNGHSWLAKKLAAEGIEFTLLDNAFVRIEDWARAQALADSLQPDALHRILDRYARECCPVLDVFGQRYHWYSVRSPWQRFHLLAAARRPDHDRVIFKWCVFDNGKRATYMSGLTLDFALTRPESKRTWCVPTNWYRAFPAQV